jgi:hypothetical protein
MTDALSNYKDTSSGMFVRIKEGAPQTLRILTLDPLVSRDQWGNTRYSFTVWNWTLDKPQILSKGPGLLKQLQEIHLAEEIDSLNQIDIKLSATGEGLETRYNVMPLPTAKTITRDMVEQAQAIKLEDKIEGGIRLSQVNAGQELPEADSSSGYEQARATARKIDGKEDTVVDDIGDEPINLEDIPF